MTAKRAEASRPTQEGGRGAQLRSYLLSAPSYGSTTDVITEVLREAILDGVLPPSTWLREDELATDLKVSRTPIREALRRLADDHLAVRLTNRGTIVAPLSLDDVLAVYLVREPLEGLAARLASLRSPPGLLASLLETHQSMVAAIPAGDIPALSSLDLTFHRLLREASENPFLDRFLIQVEHAVRRFGRSNFESPQRSQEILQEHRAIIDAIAAGDADAASERAAEHMRHARDARIRSILGSGQLTPAPVVPIATT
jgi:DNA-binding GntR family transcriptional regulator